MMLSKWRPAILALIGAICLFATTAPADAQAPPTTNKAHAESNQQESPAATRPPPAQSAQTDWAISELIRIGQEMRQVNDQLNEISSRSGMRVTIDDAARSLAQLRGSVPACDAPPATRVQFDGTLAQTMTALARASRDLPSFYPWERTDSAELRETCGEPLANNLQSMIDGVANLSTELDQAAASRGDLERTRNELERRKREIVTQMSDQVASARVSQTMPWILLIIFGAGGLLLLSTKLFTAEVQTELVASGQMVQFVTILILFGAILALGLADKLQEQTLAALLGGMAGYVLSQGIKSRSK